MASVNDKLADIFQEMADILEIKGGDRFRINAFAKASRVIGDLTDDIEDIGPDAKKLTALDGIGKGTAERIIQFLEDGKIDDHEDLKASIPEGLLPLLSISGLGPKTIALMWNEAGIESLDDLKEKLKGDELTKLPRMGEKKLESIRKSIAFAESSGGRINIGRALPWAKWFAEQLRQLKEVKNVAWAGSLRRGKETIGDIDLLVAAADKDRGKIAKAFRDLEPVEEVLVGGSTKTSVRVNVAGAGPMQVDLRIVEPSSYGAALLYFTGSKEHNVALRERAIKQGMTLNEYALTKEDSGDVVASQTEEDIYKALDLKWVAPELRENRGEIALADKDKLPDLIKLADIKAELHAHTTASDGKWSIRELASAAADRGFHTIAITDHSKGQAQANGLDNKRLEAHIEAIHKVRDDMKGKITVLAGTEVDILSDGKLDYPNSLLKQLDIVVASPHAALSQNPAVATKRLLKAIANPYVTILGHPTGRLVNRREGLSPDMKKLIAAAKEHGVALEINANCWRLDLRDTHARAALDAGVKLAINTDAHGPADLDQLTYGILTARRAGATKDDVINCMPNDALTKWLKARQG